MGEYTPILIGLLLILLLPWIILIFIAIYFRPHFSRFKFAYIGGTILVEFFLLMVLLGVGRML